MLKRLYVDNFKTLVNVEWLPGTVNLLVGENNSGKSNLCNALRFISLSAQATIAETAGLVGESWQLHNVYLPRKSTLDFDCTSELLIDDVASCFRYILRLERTAAPPPAMRNAATYQVEFESLSVARGGEEPIDLLVNDRGSVRLLHEKRYFGEEEHEPYVETSAPREATMLFRLYDLQTNRLANAFKKYLQSWMYFSLNPHAMRLPPPAGAPLGMLLPDGANLAAVLHLMKNVRERDYRRVRDLVASIEPAADSISFLQAQDNMLMWLDDGRGHTFSPHGVSDGTLRFLALAFVIVSTRAWMRESGLPAPLIIFEEPENGVYVRLLRQLFDLIETEGEVGQYVFTTHSPYVIDLFDRQLEAITVAVRRDTHTELRKPDRSRIGSLLDDMSLGEMHFRELLQ